MTKGNLVQNRIVVWSVEEARRLFSGGFFGKPLGIPKPKGADFDAPLIVDLIEGFYLTQKGKLDIHDAKTGDKITRRQIRKICAESYADFESKFIVYSKLRDAGFVVSPGIKFGCDFAVYEHGPGIDHAPYLVQVASPEDLMTATGIVLSGRLATTVRKQFIIAVPFPAKKSVEFIAFDWWRPSYF